jgi:hypothetical protein
MADSEPTDSPASQFMPEIKLAPMCGRLRGKSTNAPRPESTSRTPQDVPGVSTDSYTRLGGRERGSAEHLQLDNSQA